MSSTLYAEYRLTEEQIYTALKKSGMYKTSGKRVIVENLLLLACAGYFIYECIVSFSAFSLIMALVSLIFMAVITFVPAISMKRLARQQAGKNVKMWISPKKILMEDDEKKWEIQLDGTIEYKIVEDIIVLVTENKGFVIIPTKSLPKDTMTEIQTMIFNGTYRK